MVRREVDEILTVDEIAARLKVSPWTIRAWRSMGYIPCFKLRGVIRFRMSEIEKWLRKNERAGRSLHRLKIEWKMHGVTENSVLN